MWTILNMIKNVNDLKTSDLAAIGMNYGYSRTRRHPSAKPFIKQTQNGIDSIDLEFTISQMKTAIEFLKSVQASGRQILFVGVKPETRQKIKEIALSIGAPYVAERFIGGTLTNYPQFVPSFFFWTRIDIICGSNVLDVIYPTQQFLTQNFFFI